VEWPRNSGNPKEYPEVDRAGWFHVEQGRRKILRGQRDFIDRLMAALEYPPK
jgi:predicted NUDIX family NTP pyrophosphohydrolase